MSTNSIAAGMIRADFAIRASGSSRASGTVDDADVGLDRAERVVRRLRFARAREGVEERGFPDVGQPDDSGAQHWSIERAPVGPLSGLQTAAEVLYRRGASPPAHPPRLDLALLKMCRRSGAAARNSSASACRVPAKGIPELRCPEFRAGSIRRATCHPPPDPGSAGRGRGPAPARPEWIIFVGSALALLPLARGSASGRSTPPCASAARSAAF